MRIICVGDNVVDCYLDQHLYYPGGNAVNVAVHCSRCGAERVAYMGVFGDDAEAEHIKWALCREGVEFERSRKVYAPSGHPRVSLTADGDRVFVASPDRTAQRLFRIRLIADDLAFIGGFDLCHTSVYSGIEPELRAICPLTDVSFDFSTNHEPGYIDEVAGYVRYAFFSGADLTERELDDIILRCHDLGTEIVGITLGSRGALFSRRGERYRQKPIPSVHVVDTMGAGDSFIAGFLIRYNESRSIDEALVFASEKAASTCGSYGGFGYPRTLK